MNLNELYEIICDRRDHPTTQSYTASLFEDGIDKILQKVGEEAIEVILAGKGQGKQRLIEEVADLTYHTLVLLAASSVTPEEINQELAKRHK